MKNRQLARMTAFQCMAFTTLLALPAHAQDIAPGNNPAAQLESIDEKLTAPSTTSDGGRLQPAARIIGATDKTSAQITFSTHSEGRSAPANTDFSITLTAPLSEDTGRADFLTVDGLPSQWSVGATLSFSLINFDGVNQAIGIRAKLLDRARQNCLVAPANQQLSVAERSTKCDLMESQVGDYLQPTELQELNAAHKTVYDGLERKSFTLINLSGTVGTQEFSHFDPGTLGKTSERKLSYSGSIWAGFLPQLSSKFFLVGGFEAKRAYSDADKATYCPTGTATPTVKCTTGPFGPPKEEIDYKIAGKVRYKVSGSVGIEIAAAYDFHDKSWGIEAPIYFIVDKDGGLTGGIRAGYDSKEKDVQFGIFIGQTFGFLKL